MVRAFVPLPLPTLRACAACLGWADSRCYAVISHISVGEHDVFVTTASASADDHDNKPKEKQAESIVEKLCQRFRLSEDTRQWRDIAFCLSLLPFKSERSVKKLIEGLPFYRDKLHEEGVYARFQEILVKVRTRLWQANARTAPPIPSLPFLLPLNFRITLKLLTFTLRQARSNKAANKPDSELNEFETVRLFLSLSLFFFPSLASLETWRGVARDAYIHTLIYIYMGWRTRSDMSYA